jgi:hypothetical protein
MDIILQSDYVATNKNRNAIPKGYNPDLHGIRQTIWVYVLGGHAFSHGIAVYFVTNSFLFFCIETVSHAVIDFFKCEKKYGIHTDQFLHFSFKVLYVYLLSIGIS